MYIFENRVSSKVNLCRGVSLKSNLSLKSEFDLAKCTVGILGMAFKADVDDIRDSLSFKLGKVLRFEGSNVLYSDEFAKNSDFIKATKLIELSDIIIIGTPHTVYKDLTIPKDVKLVDPWGIIEQDL